MHLRTISPASTARRRTRRRRGTTPCGTGLPDLQLAFPTADPEGPQTVYVPRGALVDGWNVDGNNSYTWLGATDGSGSLGVPFFSSMYVEFDVSGPALRFGAAT